MLILFNAALLSDVTNVHVLTGLLCGPCDRLSLLLAFVGKKRFTIDLTDKLTVPFSVASCIL